MFDPKKLLDALVAANSRPGGIGGAIGQVVQEAVAGLQDAAQKAGQAPTVGQQVDKTVGVVAGGVASGQKPNELMSKAKQVMANNPGLAEAAVIGLAGLLMGSRRRRGIRPNLAGLGGLALVGGLAYKAWENYQSGKPAIDLSGQGTGAAAAGAGSGGQAGAGRMGGQGSAQASAQSAGSGPAETEFSAPQSSRFHPVSHTEDDALLFVRAMVAAASADGQIDEAERSRIVKGLSQAGIDAEATRWLESEMASPASVDELSDRITDPEKAAQVYTAARLAIDPDTIQEREFLRQLAEALDLDQSLRSQIDSTAAAVKLG